MNLKKTLKQNVYVFLAYTSTRDFLRKLLWSDKAFKLKTFRKTHGRNPNLENPKSFSEKLLWSSLNYRDDRFVRFADKYLVRKHVAEVIGEEYLIPIYDVFEDIKQMNISNYPNKFVLNATHGSNMILICNDKETFDYNNAKKLVNSWLHRNYYNRHREWHYKYIKPRVLCMENICDENGVPPLDYKFFCFDGKPYIVVLDIERFGDSTKRNVYDMNWKQVEGVSLTRPQVTDKEYQKPENFEKMKELAIKLAQGFEHVRVDLYNVNGKIYFGELTFLHAAAGILGKISPYSYNEELGDLFKLPKRNIDDWKYNGE